MLAKLTDPELLAEYLAKRQVTQAQLGRAARMNRQKIWALLNRYTVRCTVEQAERIELELDLVPGTLFRIDDDASELVA